MLYLTIIVTMICNDFIYLIVSQDYCSHKKYHDLLLVETLVKLC